MRGSKGGRGAGGPDPLPLKNHKIYGSVPTCSGSLKNHKATKPGSMLGHHWLASETPFKWRFAGGPMMARF